MYLNRENKEKAIALFILPNITDHYIKQEDKAKELFGSKGFGWLKMAKSFLTKSIEELAVNVGPEEWMKIHKVARHSDFIIMSRGVKPSDQAVQPVKTDALYNLAEIAMGRECVGCSKCDWKKCRVFHALRDADIPAAQETKKDCPYRQ